jgi:hypothetical protein
MSGEVVSNLSNWNCPKKRRKKNAAIFGLLSKGSWYFAANLNMEAERSLKLTSKLF